MPPRETGGGPWEDGPAGAEPRLPAPGLCVSRPFSFCGGRVRTEERGTSGCKVELQMGPSPEELEGQERALRTPAGPAGFAVPSRR